MAYWPLENKFQHGIPKPKMQGDPDKLTGKGRIKFRVSRVIKNGICSTK